MIEGMGANLRILLGTLITTLAVAGCTANGPGGNKVTETPTGTGTGTTTDPRTTPSGFRTEDFHLDGADVDSSRPQMCALDGGVVLVAWADDRDGSSAVWAIASSDGGRNWPAAPTRVSDGTDRVHVSFDLDALDPEVAPGVGTPVKGGLDYREAHLLMEMLSDSGLMTSLEVVEANPILDVRNASAAFAVELVQSAFGKRIL